MLQLAVAVATGGYQLGHKMEKGPVIFYTAEEEVGDLKVRLIASAHPIGVERLDLSDLLLIPLGVEVSAVLGAQVSGGKIEATEHWSSLVNRIETIQPKLVIIDPLNEVFDGDELKRVQARQFVGLMRPVAAKHDLAVIVRSPVENRSQRTHGNIRLDRLVSGLSRTNVPRKDSGRRQRDRHRRAQTVLKKADRRSACFTDRHLRRAKAARRSGAPTAGRQWIEWDRDEIAPRHPHLFPAGEPAAACRRFRLGIITFPNPCLSDRPENKANACACCAQISSGPT